MTKRNNLKKGMSKEKMGMMGAKHMMPGMPMGEKKKKRKMVRYA